jgi:hypothetical protein
VTGTEVGTVVLTEQGSGRGPGRPRDERASSAITDAALRQLRTNGYGNVTMESVAVEAGVARATIYRRYRDKADLVTAAIATNSTGHLVEGPSDDPRRDLVAYLDSFEQRYAEGCSPSRDRDGGRADPVMSGPARPTPRGCRPRPGRADAARIGVRPARLRCGDDGRLGRTGRRRRLDGHGGALVISCYARHAR